MINTVLNLRVKAYVYLRLKNDTGGCFVEKHTSLH